MIRVNLNRSGHFISVMYNENEDLLVRYNIYGKKHEYVSKYGNEYSITPLEDKYHVEIDLIGNDKSKPTEEYTPVKQDAEVKQASKQQNNKKKNNNSANETTKANEVKAAEAAAVDHMLAEDVDKSYTPENE